MNARALIAAAMISVYPALSPAATVITSQVLGHPKSLNVGEGFVIDFYISGVPDGALTDLAYVGVGMDYAISPEFVMLEPALRLYDGHGSVDTGGVVLVYAIGTLMPPVTDGLLYEVYYWATGVGWGVVEANISIELFDANIGDLGWFQGSAAVEYRIAAVPEPSSIALIATAGAVGCIGWSRGRSERFRINPHGRRTR